MGVPAVDGGVVEACRRGDQEAFRVLFETYKDSVFSMARYLSRDEDVARDITQEVFLRVFRTIRNFRGDASFATWLFRVVLNTFIDEQRRRKHFLPLMERAGEKSVAESGSLEERFGRNELAEAVKTAVVRLRPKLRVPVLLRYLGGLSYSEIASVLGCSSGTVASRLNRGHQILARQLRHLRGTL